MKRNIFYLLFFLLPSILCFSQEQQQQKILQVGAGEYLTTYRTDHGKLFLTTRLNGRYRITRVPVSNVTAVDGAQYTNIALDSAGAVFIIGVRPTGLPYAKLVPLDEEGNSFVGNSNVYGWFKAYVTLKQGEIFIWGEDILKINKGFDVPVPRRLPLPQGKKIKKLVPVTMDNPRLLALATDGTVWQYIKGKMKAEKIILPQPARDIAGVGSAACVIETGNDLLAWGYLGSYLGLADMGNKPTSIKKQWTAAGCVFPSKELVGNYNTLHIIDANDHLFGGGENVQGEVGNGKEHPDWENYRPNSYAWNWEHGQMVTKPVQIPGKFKNLCTNNTLAFYFYVQDMGDAWYSWGRNKARCLGNGITLTPDDESRYPNALTVPAPTLVTPLTINWKVLDKIEFGFRPPLFVHAGVNQYLKNNHTTLSGRSSWQQGGSIVSYQWDQVEGAEASIANPSAAATEINNLKAGSYRFRLTATNNFKESATSQILVTVE